MANSKIPYVNLNTNIDTWRTRFNDLIDSVGDVSTLTTTAGPLTGAVNELDAEIGSATLTTTATAIKAAINEHDAELGVITAGAMGTTAATVSGAIKELDSDIGANPKSNLTTTAKDLTAAINEHDAELGTITAGAMGTTAGTISGAISELEVEIDTLNTRVEPTQAFSSAFTATSVMDALNELKTQTDLLDSGSSDQIAQIGDLNTLNTTAKGSLVAATNEVFGLVDSAGLFRNKVSATDAGGDGSFGYNENTGVFTYTGPSASEVRAHFTAGTNIAISSGQISLDGSLDHDQLTNFVANEHIDHTGVSVTAGTGLTGGGTIATNRTLNVIGGVGITANANDIAVDSSFVTGLISVTDAGGDGSLSYSSGAITYTGPSASQTRAHFSAGEGIDISSGSISGEDATTTNKGIASFATADFSVASGAVSIKSLGVSTGQIANNAVTLAKTATIANNRIIGNISGSTAVASALTGANVRTIINVADGANAYTHPNHSGDVTSNGDGVTTIAANAVHNTMINNSEITSGKFNGTVTFLIKNSAGTTVNTLYSPGS